QYLLAVANRALDDDLRAKGGASDLVQDTFLEAQKDFGRFQGTTADELRAWLGAILHHNLANFGRQFRATDKRDVAREVPFDPDDSRLQLAAFLKAGSPSPSSQAMRDERVQVLQQALERLPDHYLQVILLRERERRSFEEIGQLLNRSPEAVRKLWAR